MGQVQSEVATAGEDRQAHSAASNSIDSLITEAAAYGNDGNESLDAKAQKALECPCIADLRKGPCGLQFSEAFVCYLKSTVEEKTGFGMEEILRKYIRYTLNEKPFNPETVSNLIQLRKASLLNDSQVAEIVNEISRRIVRDKGPVVMDMAGYTERGFKRKLAVQALFGKLFYLSEFPEFCSKDSSLIVKEIFGVTDEDADKIRIHTASEAGDIESLQKMVDDPDSEDSGERSS